MHTLIAFLVAFGVLVVFHELGHYSVARLCGVKVLRFSMGIGKVVWSRRFGRDQTEWAISMLPLGGYVQMLDARDQDMGAVAPEDLNREYTRQSVWRRMAIVAAGPAANFLLAILIYCGLYMHGVQQPVAKLATVQEQTAAYRAGLRGGEVVSAVNGRAVHSWSDLQWVLTQAVIDKESAQLEVQRAPGVVSQVAMTTSDVSEKDLEQDFMGKLGLAVASAPLLGKVDPAGPAMRAGLHDGDVVVSIDGHTITDQQEMRDLIRVAAGRMLHFVVRRGSEVQAFDVTPDTVVNNGRRIGQIKVLLPLKPDMVSVAEPPLAALGKAARQTWEMAALDIKMIGKMLIGQASLKNLTGPGTIAEYAGETARAGATVYIGFIAFISISLGVMNLLPIPVLDGGLLLYYSLEVLTGRPVSARFGAIAQRAGIGILMMLMLVAVFNDIARHLT